MHQRNVFSDKTEISLLIHTQSYLENGAALKYLSDADKLEGINIFFMPMLNGNVSNLPLGRYIHNRESNRTFSILKFPQCSGVVKIHNMPDAQISDVEYCESTEQSILQGQCVSNLFDYIVTEKSAPDPFDCEIPVISLSECREILRLRMICCGDYHVSEHFRIEETLYYIYRHKYIFPSYQQFWSSCVENNNLDWADALDNRLNLMARCLDQCKISAYKRIDNNSIMHIKYHLSYLFLLITGAFDNLAWLMNNLYQMELEKRSGGHFNIDLKKTVFQDVLKEKSKNVYSVISDTLFQCRLDAIRELRDRIVHRDFLQAYRGGNANSRNETSYFDADSVFYSKLKQAGFSDSNVAIKIGTRNLLYMIPFINFLEMITVKMIDDMLKVITKDIYGKKENIVLWELFEFPCEPYVL